MSSFLFPKVVTMSVLEEQVVRLGICPKCHKKTLRDEGNFDGTCRLYQCWICKTMWVL